MVNALGAEFTAAVRRRSVLINYLLWVHAAAAAAAAEVMGKLAITS